MLILYILVRSTTIDCGWNYICIYSWHHSFTSWIFVILSVCLCCSWLMVLFFFPHLLEGFISLVGLSIYFKIFNNPCLSNISNVIAVRAAIFGILWVLLGKRVWFFPNINAEETTFRELIRFWPEKDEGERPKWTSRLFYALVAIFVILLLRHHAPDEAARAR